MSISELSSASSSLFFPVWTYAIVAAEQVVCVLPHTFADGIPPRINNPRLLRNVSDGWERERLAMTRSEGGRSTTPVAVVLLRCGRRGVFLSPLARGRDGGLLVLLPGLGDLGSERVVWVGRAEERLDGEENRSDLEGGRPVV